MLKPDSENFTGNDRFQGYCVDLTKRLAEILNISYEMKIVKDGGFGSLINCKTYDFREKKYILCYKDYNFFLSNNWKMEWNGWRIASI